jgi:hypothetical protein
MAIDWTPYLPLRCAMCGLPLGECEGQAIDGVGRVCDFSDCIARARGEKPVVRPGERVYFWTPQTGTVAQLGRVRQTETKWGCTYAEIVPATPPYTPVFLFYRATWGFEPVNDR